MLRIPLRFHREFKTTLDHRGSSHSIVCEYYFIAKSWCLKIDGSTIRPKTNPNINTTVDVFKLASDNRSYKAILKRWIQKEVNLDGMACKSCFSYLEYALTDRKRIRPLWNVWGGTLRYGKPSYNNRAFGLVVRSDGRIVNETTALTDGTELSDVVFDRFYQAGGVWVSVYDTEVLSMFNDQQAVHRVYRYGDDRGSERVLPHTFRSVGSTVMFLRSGRLCLGTLLLMFSDSSPDVSYVLTFVDYEKHKTGSYSGDVPFGRVPKSNRNNARYYANEICELYQKILDEIFPDVLTKDLGTV